MKCWNKPIFEIMLSFYEKKNSVKMIYSINVDLNVTLTCSENHIEVSTPLFVFRRFYFHPFTESRGLTTEKYKCLISLLLLGFLSIRRVQICCAYEIQITSCQWQCSHRHSRSVTTLSLPSHHVVTSSNR